MDESLVTQIDVERAVRNQLYGERSELTVAPLATTAVPDRRGAELLGGRYRLLSRIGAGGMTNVYCARDELLKRRVAVKVMAEPLASDACCLRQFRLDAELWAGLAHPLIVPVFDAGAVPRPFIVMELVPGVSALALARGPQLTLDRAMSIVAQVAEALTFAHEHEIVHRDVSPGNVLIRRSDGAARLTDFGLACRADQEAPEILGAKLPAGVAEVIDRALEPDPDDRQSSVAEFRAQLLAAHGSPGLVQREAA